MKRFNTPFGTWFAWLAFWRKPAVPIPEPVDTPAPEAAKASRSIEPEPSEVAAIPAPKAGWFARLMQVFRRQHKAAPEQTEATDVIEKTSTPKPSLLSRFRNKFRRQSVPEAPEETRDAVHHNGQKPARTTVSDNENTPEDAPKIGFFKRWLAKLCNKWVWIPCVGVLLLSLIGSVLWIVLHTTQEKEKLQAELQAKDYEKSMKLKGAQLALDTLAIDAYLVSNKINALKTKEGVRYMITKAGSGDSPVLSSTVKVNYKGSLLADGSVFDQSQSPIEFPLTNLIQGWQVGFQKLQKGCRATLYIPSSLGYGPNGSPPQIPANANLVFEIELIDFK